MRLVSHERKGHEYLLTVAFDPSWLGRLFRRKPRVYTVVGSCTVWYMYPSFARCSTSFELLLSNVWAKLKYEQKHGAVA